MDLGQILHLLYAFRANLFFNIVYVYIRVYVSTPFIYSMTINSGI
jgi:hypothetical protein